MVVHHIIPVVGVQVVRLVVHMQMRPDVRMVRRVVQMVVVVPELVVSHIHIVIPVRVDRMHQVHLVVMGLREQ